jgi:hypothetical protein
VLPHIGPISGIAAHEDNYIATGLAQLREIRGDLFCARVGALQLSLSGARAERARELTEKIGDAIAHVERLLFFLEGDLC